LSPSGGREAIIILCRAFFAVAVLVLTGWTHAFPQGGRAEFAVADTIWVVAPRLNLPPEPVSSVFEIFDSSAVNLLIDAARVDGCSTFRIYWQIALPLSIPALATVALFTFMFTFYDV